MVWTKIAKILKLCINKYNNSFKFKTLKFLFLISLFPFNLILAAHTETVSEEWMKSYGGNGSEQGPFTLIETGDGNMATVYRSTSTDNNYNSKGSSDMVFHKFSPKGDTIWMKTWGGTGQDRFDDILLTSDGGFIITGWSASTDAGFTNKGARDGVIIKYDKNGDFKWLKSWG